MSDLPAALAPFVGKIGKLAHEGDYVDHYTIFDTFADDERDEHHTIDFVLGSDDQGNRFHWFQWTVGNDREAYTRDASSMPFSLASSVNLELDDLEPTMKMGEFFDTIYPLLIGGGEA
jgi:hypothetical protein